MLDALKGFFDKVVEQSRPDAPALVNAPFKLGRLPTHPVLRAHALQVKAGVTNLDLSLVRPTRRYVDGRQRFTLTHLGRPTRLAPQPSAKAVARVERRKAAAAVGTSQASEWTHNG